MRLEDLGLIGNCQFSALVERTGAIVWCCLPRFDSEPVFSTLLDATDGGHFLVGPGGRRARAPSATSTTPTCSRRPSRRPAARSASSTSRRASSSTTAPSGRPSSSASSSRSSGTPRIRVRCEPRLGWSKQRADPRAGLEPRALRGLPEPAPPDDRHPDLLPGAASRSPSPSAGTWCSRGAQPVEEPLAPLCDRFLQRDAALLAALGQGMRRARRSSSTR